MRPASQRRLLQVHRDKILCVELRGELFFGSSQQVLQQVRRTAVHGAASVEIVPMVVGTPTSRVPTISGRDAKPLDFILSSQTRHCQQWRSAAHVS